MSYSSPAARKGPLPDIKDQIFAGKFAEAARAQQAGRYDEARRILLELLAVNVRHGESLYLLGVVEYHCQHHEVAVKMIERALAVDSRNPVYHANLGKILVEMGRQEEGEAELRLVVRLKPEMVDGHYGLGNLCSAQGKFDEAVEHYQRALRLVPRDANIRTNFGNAYLRMGKTDEAFAQYRQALEFDPKNIDAHLNMGTAYLGKGEWEKALASYEQVLVVEPRHALAYYNIGVCYQRQKKYAEAQSAYEKALAIEPDSKTVTLNLISALRFQKKYADSEEYCRKMIAHHPEYAEGYCGIGDIYFDQDDFEPAIEYYQKAIERKPDYAEAYSNLGCVYSKMGRMEEAERFYNKAIASDPDHVNAHCNLSFLQLTLGDYENGLYHHEWRFRHSSGAAPLYPGEQWKGQNLKGERVLLYGEQGLGDSLQFLRYLPQVRQAGATVLLAIQHPLRRLVEQIDGIAEYYYPGDLFKPYDYQCALMSLPKAFHTTPETIPATVPYLKVPKEAQEAADALEWPEKGLRVGLVWAGNPNHTNDANRSIPLKALAPLWQVEGVHFYSLQMGAGTAQLAEAAGPLIDLTPGIEDFADTAARLMKLDLLIAVDTSVVHMAGALGRPIWMMIPYVPDWRWFLDRSDSPWYPSMRLFRQTEIGDWASVVEPIRAALTERTAQGQ